MNIIGVDSPLLGQVNDHFSDGASIREVQSDRLSFISRRRISSIGYCGDFVLPIDFHVESNPMWTFISEQFLDQPVTIFSWGRCYEGLLHAVGDELLTLKARGRFDRVALRIRDIDRFEV